MRDGLGRIQLLRDLGFEGGLALLDERVPNEEDVLQMFVNAGVSEDEALPIYRRTMRGRKARIRAGSWVGGHSPFGHRVEDSICRETPRKLAVDEREQRVVERAAALLIDEMCSTARTAELLNAEGLLPRPNRLTGGPRRWNSYRLRRILKSESLAGRWTWGKRGKGIEEPITVEVPAVLPRERWEELQAVLHKSERGPYAQTAIYPLSGRVVAPCKCKYVGYTTDPARGRADAVLRQA